MKLIFNNPQKTYYSGETVSGRLVIHLKESITLRSMNLVNYLSTFKNVMKENKLPREAGL